MDADAYFWAGMAGGRYNQIKRQNGEIAEQSEAIGELYECIRQICGLRDTIVQAAEERGVPAPEIWADENVKKQREAVLHAAKSAQSLYEIGRGFKNVEPYPHPDCRIQRQREKAKEKARKEERERNRTTTKTGKPIKPGAQPKRLYTFGHLVFDLAITAMLGMIILPFVMLLL